MSSSFGRSGFSYTTRRVLRTNLSDLPGLFAEWMPDTLLQNILPNTRQRPFTRAVVFWLFLSQCLTRSQPCREAVHKLLAWIHLCGRTSISKKH